MAPVRFFFVHGIHQLLDINGEESNGQTLNGSQHSGYRIGDARLASRQSRAGWVEGRSELASVSFQSRSRARRAEVPVDFLRRIALVSEPDVIFAELEVSAVVAHAVDDEVQFEASSPLGFACRERSCAGRSVRRVELGVNGARCVLQLS